MEGLYVSNSYLKTAHYFFYSMAVLYSLLAINVFGEFAGQSFIMFVSSLIYINASAWTAYFLYRDYKSDMTTVQLLREQLPPYILLVIYVAVAAETFMLLVPGSSAMIYSVLFVNYYYIIAFSMAVIFALLRPVRGLFQTRNQNILGMAKEKALEFSRLKGLAEYREGSNHSIDDALEDVLLHEDSPGPSIRRLETEICQQRINELKLRLNEERQRASSMARLQSEKAEYEKILESLRKR